jgi:ribokinase
MSPRICVVGSSNIDLTFRTARLPRPGETLPGKAFQMGYGGKGANQAVMAARLGGRVSMVSRVGNDVFGEDTLRNFRACGIDTTHVSRDTNQPTGTAAILVDDHAQNCIIVAPGANAGLTPTDIEAAESVIRQSDVVLFQLEVPVETTAAALRLARIAGVRTILNPAPAAALPNAFLELADLCVPNELELEILTNTQADVEAAAKQLLGRGPKTVIVTLGERGALLVAASTVEHFPGLSVTPVDTSGAGDAFIGSLSVFLAESGDLRESIRGANVAAALSVTRCGTQSSFPTRLEVEERLRQVD